MGKPHTEEVKNKISTSLKGRKLKSETIEKRLLTIQNYDYNKKQEINNKISKSKKGKIKTSKQIEQYDLNEILINTYLTVTDAAKELNVCRSSIQRCCDGKYKQVKGYIWKFKY